MKPGPMMKLKNIFILILALAPAMLQAQSTLIQQADQAYLNNNFEEALSLYEQARDSLGTSSQLDYNIANTYYRLNQPGKAVLYYKKALKLDPSNADARTNLEFVQTKLIDQQDHSRSWGERVKENVIFLMTPNAWAVVGIIFFIVFLVALAAYIHGDSVKTKKLSFFGGLFMIALAVLCTIVAFHTSALARDDKEAVVIDPVVQLSTVPRMPQDKAEHAFSLHEGALVEVIDSLFVPTDSVNPHWLEVKVNDEHRAWLPASTVQRI